jgi:hypothetical protein
LFHSGARKRKTTVLIPGSSDDETHVVISDDEEDPPTAPTLAIADGIQEASTTQSPLFTNLDASSSPERDYDLLNDYEYDYSFPGAQSIRICCVVVIRMGEHFRQCLGIKQLFCPCPHRPRPILELGAIPSAFGLVGSCTPHCVHCCPSSCSIGFGNGRFLPALWEREGTGDQPMGLINIGGQMIG